MATRYSTAWGWAHFGKTSLHGDNFHRTHFGSITSERINEAVDYLHKGMLRGAGAQCRLRSPGLQIRFRNRSPAARQDTGQETSRHRSESNGLGLRRSKLLSPRKSAAGNFASHAGSRTPSRTTAWPSSL